MSGKMSQDLLECRNDANAVATMTTATVPADPWRFGTRFMPAIFLNVGLPVLSTEIVSRPSFAN